MNWDEYGMNLNEDIVRKNLPLEKMFVDFEFNTNNQSNDLYFWGIKK